MTGRAILVSGAGGFVGCALAEGFRSLGWRVIALDRSFDAAARARLAGTEQVEADLAAGVPDGIAADAAIHAAALTTDAAAAGLTPAAHVAANMRPLLAMLDWAAAARPRAFAFLSSSGVFGPGDGAPDLLDACIPTGRGPYAAAKLAGEVLVPAALPEGTAAHVVRLGYIFGPGEAARPTRTRVSRVADWLARARAGLPLPVPADDPRRDWTWAPDLAPALARLLDAPAAGRPLHLGSGRSLRDSALAALIAAAIPGTRTVPAPALGAKPPMVPSRMPALDGLAWTDPAAGIAALLHEGVPA
jgi:nucleoside-diphosphate-sugar epimerase